MKKGGRLRVRAISDTNDVKDNIQGLVRDIVIIRDNGCVLKNVSNGFDVPYCNGFAKDGHLILQADHLVTRANSATYSDTRLIACVCKGHHGWKNWNKEKYDALMRQILPANRVALWNQAMDARYHAHRNFTYDWRLEEAALKQELAQLQKEKGVPVSVIQY